MTAARLSKAQRDALELVRAGRIQYGMEEPSMARRAHARGNPMTPVWILDSYGAYGHLINTLRVLEQRGIITVRRDLLPTVTVPETVKTHQGVAGGIKTVTIPAHAEPADPGWRAAVEVSS